MKFPHKLSLSNALIFVFLWTYTSNKLQAMKKNAINQMMLEEDNQLKKLHQIVQDTIEEEQLIVNNLLNPPEDFISRGQKISDRVARFGGSWVFIIWFMCILFFWISYNALAPGKAAFDPYPFILMNLVLSCIAALQAPIIMMSQNRQEEKDRMRGENDYMINLKAEMEIRKLHLKMDLLLEEQVKTICEAQSRQFQMLAEINAKLKKMEEK
ncbi:hypothetical protein PBAL39_25375 [Pedobacter sp. BAL39]|nr:hypothetical protein PBAL39_25375 [Pedobacter sp. BAL39]